MASQAAPTVGHIFSAAYDLARFENRAQLRPDFRRSLLELAFDANASTA
jgi:hypothetical protein